MESLIKLECPTPPELDLCENLEPSVPQIVHPATQDISKLTSHSPNTLSVSPLEEKIQTRTAKNYGKTRELYVKLVRFDSPSTKAPINKIRVKDFAVFPNDEAQTKASPGVSAEEKTHSKMKQESNKSQPYTSLAAKLMHAHFVRSPILQSLLSDVLQLQRSCNSPISDSSIETEIRTIKEQYNLFDVDPTVIDYDDVNFYEDYESMDSFNVIPGESSMSSFGASTATLESSELQYNVTGMETSNPDPKLVNITLSNGLVFELDPNVPECPICSKSFKAFNSLKQHLKYCFTASSHIKTEPVTNQNETPGQFVLKQELSIDSPLKIQQVFSSENMPSELRVATNNPAQTGTAKKRQANRVKTGRQPKRKLILRPKSISSGPETTEVTIKQEDHDISSPSTSQVLRQNVDVEELQRKVSGPLYYCCLCDQTAITQKDLVLNCAVTRKSKRKLANCQACRWKNPGEPFFLMHNKKFQDLRALPLKCSTCRGLMYNHHMFVSHEVRKECTKASETVVTTPVNIPCRSDDSKEMIVID